MGQQNNDEDLWLATQGQDIQDFEIPEIETINTPVPDFMEIDDQEEKKDRVTATDVNTQFNLQKLQQPTAELFVNLIDIIIPIVLLFVFKNINKDDAKLEENEKDALISAFAQYLATKEVNVSPGMALIMTIVSIYGAKIFMIKAMGSQQTVVKIDNSNNNG
jgi:hypothetical protein